MFHVNFFLPARTSEDYTESLRWARKLTDDIMETVSRFIVATRPTHSALCAGQAVLFALLLPLQVNTGLSEEQQINIFPYTLHYVYYEQYLTMWEDTWFLLGISLAAVVSVVTCLLGFDVSSVAAVTAIVVMVLVDEMGLMYWCADWS